MALALKAAFLAQLAKGRIKPPLPGLAILTLAGHRMRTMLPVKFVGVRTAERVDRPSVIIVTLVCVFAAVLGRLVQTRQRCRGARKLFKFLSTVLALQRSL